jgi:hypothetical protein
MEYKLTGFIMTHNGVGSLFLTQPYEVWNLFEGPYNYAQQTNVGVVELRMEGHSLERRYNYDYDVRVPVERWKSEVRAELMQQLHGRYVSGLAMAWDARPSF